MKLVLFTKIEQTVKAEKSYDTHLSISLTKWLTALQCNVSMLTMVICLSRVPKSRPSHSSLEKCPTSGNYHYDLDKLY